MELNIVLGLVVTDSKSQERLEALPLGLSLIICLVACGQDPARSHVVRGKRRLLRHRPRLDSLLMDNREFFLPPTDTDGDGQPSPATRTPQSANIGRFCPR